MAIVNRGSPLLTVDTETREITPLVINSGDRIVRGESIRSFMEMQDKYVPLNGGRDFVKIFPDIAERLFRKLSPIESSTLYLILPFVGANHGILIHGNGEFVTRKYIVEHYGDAVSARTIDRAMHGLFRKGVLAKCYIKDKVAYIANPYIFQRGSKANATLLALFENTEWSHAKETNQPSGRNRTRV